MLDRVHGYSRVEQIYVRTGEGVVLDCDVTDHALWLYTPDETYELVEHIFSDNRMNFDWLSRCRVSRKENGTVLSVPSAHPKDSGYYECDEETGSDIAIRRRYRVIVTEAESQWTSTKTSLSTVTQRTLSKSLTDEFYGLPIDWILVLSLSVTAAVVVGVVIAVIWRHRKISVWLSLHKHQNNLLHKFDVLLILPEKTKTSFIL